MSPPASRSWYLRSRRSRRRAPSWLGWVLVVLIALLAAAALWFLRSRLPEGFSRAGHPAGAGRMAPLVACELYFGDPAGRGLQRELRFLARAEDPDRRARDVLQALIDGSLTGGLSPWPPGTKPRELFISRSGIAYVEFDESLRRDAPPGDYIEWLMAASLTRTLCANLPALRGVRVLVAGPSSGTLLRNLPLEWTFVPAMFDDAG
ncbi:MAG: GerMN domain-containing protein [Candidatus Eisenbacteria bacterium]|uniref:GerMN domain-containing protein n=1 Tax=Eiseniibacteriota bacterium TaxID=2212470 RepID=A0A937XEE2_UNCEI|nr:GerMN domain-containing protein [Candidatus Eisenbacteria bacterium]